MNPILGSRKKYEALAAGLKGYGRAAVAFSGGVDSTLLLYAARQVLGKENVVVLHGVSELISRRERKSSLAILDELAVDREMRVEVVLHPLSWPEFVVNSGDRCYVCKKRLYQKFLIESREKGCSALLDGSNVDDLKGSRPGFRAIRELGVETPLLDAKLEKEDIRSLAREFQLTNHDKVSESCLATRFSEGMVLEQEGLALVEKCEDFLIGRDFSGCRVQPTAGKNVVLGVTARDMERLADPAVRSDIIDFFRATGFGRLLLDLESRQ